MMRSQIKNVAAMSLAVVALSSGVAKADMGEVMQNAFDSMTYTSTPQMAESQRRGVISGGRLTIKNKIMKNLFTLLYSLFFIFYSNNTFSQMSYFEDFESYSSGSPIAQTSPYWNSWDDLRSLSDDSKARAAGNILLDEEGQVSFDDINDAITKGTGLKKPDFDLTVKSFNEYNSEPSKDGYNKPRGT